MSFFARFKYALHLLVAVTMILILTLAVFEGLGFITDFNVQKLMFHPLYFLLVFAIAFALAPVLFERMPISGDVPRESPDAKPPFGYATRVVTLAFLALVLALLASLVAFLLGKFT